MARTHGSFNDVGRPSAPGRNSSAVNYCGRGARFGVHSSEENFNKPYYGKLTAIAYFNGGVRMWDIRRTASAVRNRVLRARGERQHGSRRVHDQQRRNRRSRLHLHRSTATERVLDILELTGCAKDIDKGKSCKDLDNDNAPPKK
jgi:hypothetical protein